MAGKWYKSGTELLDQMRNTSLPEGMLAVWYLGQAGIAVKGGNTLAAIDLYLRDSDRRLVPRPFAPEEAVDLFDLVLCTHNHEDHLDEPTIRGLAKGSEHTVFVVPKPYRELALSYGVKEERLLGARAYTEEKAMGISLMPVPAAHEEFLYDEAGDHCCLGYLLNFAAGTLYHAGDTIEWETMTDDIGQFHPDIMCLPINGSDWTRKKRNIIGNLDAREACDVADACGADLLIPLHFDMFEGNGENPARVAEYMFYDHPGKKYHIPVCGERILWCVS